VVASFVGRRNYNRFEVERAVRDQTPIDAFGRFGDAFLEAPENDQYHLCT